MTASRKLLLAASALLAITACSGDSQASKKRDAPSAPLGFELAFAGAGTSTADDAVPEAHASVSPMIDLTPEQLAARLAAGDIRLIDVRTDAEVSEGVIPGAEHIPLDRFDPAQLGPSDGRTVVLYCRSGRRSAVAGAKLAAVTGAPVEHLAGGILAWEDAGQPLEKP
jgi:rhodanese-related sulfurtransferase